MNPNNIINLPAAAAAVIPAHRRVKIVSGKATLCADTDLINGGIGTNLQDVDAAVPGRDICAILRRTAGIHYATASGNIAADAEFTADNNGKIKTVGGGTAIGKVLEAVTGGDGSIVRVVYY